MTTLTTSQLTTLQQLRSEGSYAEAYRYLRDVVNNDPSGDPRLANWLEKAAQINSDDGGPTSEFVREATYEAARDQGVELTPVMFDAASDVLASSVIDGVLLRGSTLSMDDTIRLDVRAAVNELGLNMGFIRLSYGSRQLDIG